TSAPDILENIIALCRDSNRKIYIFIDEYDNFSNTILVTSGRQAYEELTHGEGFFRAFFNVLKMGTTDIDAPISRLFITGVSPVTMDDVTSGFNTGKNISIDPEFNQMLGFTENDVTSMIEYYRHQDLVKHETPYLLDILREWYGHYLFSKKSTTKIYNSDMVLYFMDYYLRRAEPPEDLIDRNVRIDYGKLRHLLVIDKTHYKTTNGNFNRLKQIIRDGEIASSLVKGFPVEKLIHTNNFLSLLFYFGLLTVKGVEAGELILKIPNETVKRLYYDYVSEAYEETEVFSLDLYRYNRLMHGMGYKGEWRLLFDYIAGRMRESMSLRDLITGESSIRAFLNVYLGLSSLYIIHAEREYNKGFADLFTEPFLAGYEGIKYSYLLEIKYIKKGAFKKKDKLDKEILRLVAEAEAQLNSYSLDEKFKKSTANTTLIRLVLVFSGNDLVHSEPAKSS
ncbi:MAG: AAA family ATPase, partial [bacterium]|nr:AAA family ATPase [bacterium]